MFTKKTVAMLLVASTLLPASGCSEAKAKAIALAAEEFGRSAEDALNSIDVLLVRSVAMPMEAEAEKVEKAANDLAGLSDSDVNSKALDALMTEDEIGSTARSTLSSEFTTMRDRYAEIRTVFRSLPMGSRIAAKSVASSEKLLMRLTADIYKVGANLAKQPVQFSGERSRLILQIQNDKKLTDKSARESRLRSDAHELFALRKDELAARTEAVRRCYRAAEAGRALADMVRNYGTVDAQTILDMTKESIKLSSDLGFRSEGLSSLSKRIDGAEAAVRADPYWKAVLESTNAR